MAKKRTKAQRRQAALESWKIRKAQAATGGLKTEGRRKLEALEISPGPGLSVLGVTTAGVVREGSNFVAVFSHNGSTMRHVLTNSALMKLVADGVALLAAG
jgi:hypothetical protein